MSTRAIWIAVAVVATSVLIVGFVGAIPGLSSARVGSLSRAAPLSAPEVTGTARISYQGRLTSPSGTPLNGTFPMRFQVFDSAVTGTNLWDSGPLNVDVKDGLFNVALGVDPADFTGQPLWLHLWVDGEWLSPRQELMPAPYALSLRPGARIMGRPSATDEGNAVLRVDMTGYNPWSSVIAADVETTGTAIRGFSWGGQGVVGLSADSVGVFGHSRGSWGGHFVSDSGYGIRVRTFGGRHWDHAGYFTALGGNGVMARSEHNVGVRGESADAAGVYGFSETDRGVVGSSNFWAGVYGFSVTDTGVYGRTNRPDRNYGLYTPDNLYSLNYNLAGAIMQVAQNGGDTALEPGDVVVFSGIETGGEKDAAPIVQVARAASANSTSVAGVVYSRFNAAAVSRKPEAGPVDASWDNVEVTPTGSVQPGEYLLLVIQGPAQVKASAINGAIRPGDLLSTASEPARAARAPQIDIQGVKTTAPGTVFGKALEPLDAEQALIYVFVTLQ